MGSHFGGTRAGWIDWVVGPGPSESAARGPGPGRIPVHPAAGPGSSRPGASDRPGGVAPITFGTRAAGDASRHAPPRRCPITAAGDATAAGELRRRIADGSRARPGHVRTRAGGAHDRSADGP